MTDDAPESGGLRKELGLFDVFAISTGAMFSSGFFLLPGLAAAQAGPAVVLAYLIAGLLVLPAMLSKAELATAMPKAGGTYYFLDRSLGPLVGAVGGIGTWIALILKSAFALIGMGAYLAIFFDVPIRPLAVALTLLFTLVNLVGAKESGRLQSGLVIALLSVLFFFLVQGFAEVASLGFGEVTRSQLSPFLPFGYQGLFATVGLVFVSYAGLTKVASVAEEVKDPDRNIPLGMGLSLAVATASYVLGVYVMVSVVPPDMLREDLTPVATAAEVFFDWLPGITGLVLIVVAAIAAFASTGNAGIMSASRYLLAMARDRLVWPRFAELGRFDTPTLALGATCGVMILCLLTLDVMSVAKLASAFQLLIFSLVNLSVIVLRESGIEGYEPGFCSPLYPWTQVIGGLAPLWLITEMGAMTVLFTLGMIGAALLWYHWYARDRMSREGAVLHLFERLGRQRDPDLDRELRETIKGAGVEGSDPFSELVADAEVLDLEDHGEFETVLWRVCARMSKRVGISTETLAERLLDEVQTGHAPVAKGVALPHLRLRDLKGFHLILARTSAPVRVPSEREDEDGGGAEVRAVLLLLSPESEPRLHLNLLADLASRVDDDSFMTDWLSAENDQELVEALLHDERFLSLHLTASGPCEELLGAQVRDIELADEALIALVHRGDEVVVPRGRTRLAEGDRLTIVGSPGAIRELQRRFVEGGTRS